MIVSHYLEGFSKNVKKKSGLLSRDAGNLRRDESASNSVVAMWEISFERIRTERPSS
jgi:hypothetical protein